MVEVTEEDRIAAAAYMKLVGSKRWSQEGILSGGCDHTSIVQAFATHREAAAKAERDRIVAWLRADADQTEIEAESILAKLELPDLERGAWQSLVATKRGIANAIAALESQP